MTEPRRTKTATAIAVEVASRPVSATEEAAARVRAKFFGLAPERPAPSTSAFDGVMDSMEAIQVGISGSSPFRGRFCHCFQARNRNRAPMATLSKAAAVEVAVPSSSAPSKTSTAITLTALRPRIQPNANSGPIVRALGVPSTTTTAIIGIGLRATPRAAGSRSPIKA